MSGEFSTTGITSPPTVSREVGQLLGTLRRYGPKHTEERLAAARRLAAMELTDFERQFLLAPLVKVVSGEEREKAVDSAVRGGEIALLLAAGLTVLPGIVIAVSGGFTDQEVGVFFVLVLLIFVGFVLSAGLAFANAPLQIIRSRRANNRVRAECAPALGHLGDRRALIALCNACRSRSRALRKGAADGLAALLPILEPAGGESLTGEESVALARSLLALAHDTVVAALSVLEEIGSPSALEPLKVAEYEWAYGRRGDGTDIPARIRRAIVALEARREEEQKRDTLLRPTSPNDREAATLLRSALQPGEGDPSQLLRPSEGEG